MKNADLSDLVAEAAAGRTEALFRRLELGSGLPGPRANLPLAQEFADICVGLGAKTDALSYKLANVPADEARGASTKEFLAVCGVLAIGGRAQADKSARAKAIALLEERAEDVRFRVRDAVPMALVAIGSKMGPDLVDAINGWMDRYFQAAAVLRALTEAPWLETFAPSESAEPLRLADEAFVLAREAPRSAFRYPGHKALLDALSAAPRALIKRFGKATLDQLVQWTDGLKQPELRDAILANLSDAQFKKPYAEELKKIRAGVEGSKAPPRDPTRLIQGMRSRGKKRDHHR